MALSVPQIVAASYNKVLAKARKAENQWSESAFMHELEDLGAIKHENFGPQLEIPLDWRRNPGAGFQENELDQMVASKTDVITAARYDIAELSVPIVITRLDEVKNPEENQKVKLAAQLIENAINSHDDIVEEALFGTSVTNRFIPLNVIIPTSADGSPGNIDSSVELWWRHQIVQYTNATDIVAKFTELRNKIMKGSGSMKTPKFMVSGAVPHAQYESTQQGFIRYADTKKADAGFKVLLFTTARYSFSQYGGTKVYMGSPSALQLQVSKGNFRDLGEPEKLELRNGKYQTVYSALQLVTGDRSRLGVAYA